MSKKTPLTRSHKPMNTQARKKWNYRIVAVTLVVALMLGTGSAFAGEVASTTETPAASKAATSTALTETTDDALDSDADTHHDDSNTNATSTGEAKTAHAVAASNTESKNSDSADPSSEETTDPDPQPEPEPTVKLGWVTENGNTYYYDTANHYVTGLKSIKGKKYYFSSKGILQYGILKINKKYYYANSSGIIRTTKGFISYKGTRYYVRSGGSFLTGKTFTLSKKKYRANSKGAIKTGVYKWGKYYYYSSSKGVLRTKKGRFRWKNNTYYSKKGGKLVTKKFVKSGKYYYYMQSNAAARKTKFKYHSTTLKPNSKTGAITKKQYNKASYGPYNYKKYILIDISSQKLKYYVNGKVKLSSSIVTGGPGNRTPTGRYRVGRKSRNVNLVGADYTTRVSYWIPFIGQAYGMHDATWRSSFGGSIYKYSGSHGCVNMPYSKARSLYNKVSSGTRVIVRN